MGVRLFSAPGKLLLAGGYLVLFPEYRSFVVLLSSRMHATVDSTPSPDKVTRVHITSPQFEGEWEYEFDHDNGMSLKEVNGKKNPFAESAVNVCCHYASLLGLAESPKNVKITIFSDPGYHSQLDAIEKTNGVKTFLFHGKDITEVPKTGLGSSAGLVTVLTTLLLSQFIGNSDNLTTDAELKNLIHNLAQIGHCIAQKKIGSGFDVASATFGSTIYRRFLPSVISSVVSGDFSELVSIAGSTWEFEHLDCRLPPKVKFLMGDISGGSNTPKLVSKVLDWKKLFPEESADLFSKLDSANNLLIEAINKLNDLHDNNKEQYDSLLETLKTHSSAELISYASFHGISSKTRPLLDVIELISLIRSQLRRLTRESHLEIEPFLQTQLLNYCASNFKGCLGGVVPGAGGYDAICLLCHEESIEKIVKTEVENVTWLDLHEQSEGIIEEDPENYIDIK